MNYLLIKLQDKRVFLTNKKYSKQLLEFANTFKAELHIVKTNFNKTKSLEQLANDICDTNCKQENFDYKIVKTINNKKCNKIFESIIKSLKNKKTLDILKIKNKYSKQGLQEKNIISQINKAKTFIRKIGFTLKKITKHQYKIV